MGDTHGAVRSELLSQPNEGRTPVRVTAAFSRLLALDGVWVRDVAFEPGVVVVTVVLRRRHLVCPLCGHATSARYDTRPDASTWRHLDLGVWRLEVRAPLARLRCPTHGVVTEGVPFARAGSRFTRDFEDLVGYLATTADKTTIGRLLRIDWDSVGRIITRVMGEKLDPARLEHLFTIGVDEVSWRKQARFLTLVSDHHRRCVVWGDEGRGQVTFDRFFDELGPERSSRLEAVSMDMSAGYAKSVRKEGHAPTAVICYDPYHVVALGTKALDAVRRAHWQEMRRADQQAARRFKGARWCLLKNPENLNDDQTATLRRLRRAGGAVWRAYALKEALRAIFHGDLDETDVAHLLDRFCSKAQRSGLKPFVTLAKTIRKHREGILSAIRLGVNNARHEGLNRRVRLVINRAYGFHSAKAALALVMLTVGPIEHVLPHERAANPSG
ncbi:MAG: ISL3 family transposase [Actinomycetota bacterium]|nr:ISL3 family transposase [Actinomycetota bacterium]